MSFMNTNFERTQAIVEDLRADIDFELDDVIAKIVHGLPEDYFTSLTPADQLKPLKALLALGICQLNEEVMMRSDDGQKIVVVANHNYSGQLADILRRLPGHVMLTAAKIFTSTDHDFIIDVFDFKVDGPFKSTAITPIALQHLIEEVAASTGQTESEIAEFVSHYPPTNPILESANQVAEQFLAFNDIEHSTDTSIRWARVGDSPQTRLTLSAGSTTARNLFQCAAEYLGSQQMDIEQAWLHDIPRDPELETHVAIASFLIEHGESPEVDGFRKFLNSRLT